MADDNPPTNNRLFALASVPIKPNFKSRRIVMKGNNKLGAVLAIIGIFMGLLC